MALAHHYGVMIRVLQANQPAWTIKPDYPDFPKVKTPCIGLYLSGHNSGLPAPAVMYAGGYVHEIGVKLSAGLLQMGKKICILLCQSTRAE